MDNLATPAKSSSTQATDAQRHTWQRHAYPLRQITVKLQGTRQSQPSSVIEQLTTVLVRLRAGDLSGSEHDDDFGYAFKVEPATAGPSFFEAPADIAVTSDSPPPPTAAPALKDIPPLPDRAIPLWVKVAAAPGALSLAILVAGGVAAFSAWSADGAVRSALLMLAAFAGVLGVQFISVELLSRPVPPSFIARHAGHAGIVALLDTRRTECPLCWDDLTTAQAHWRSVHQCALREALERPLRERDRRLLDRQKESVTAARS